MRAEIQEPGARGAATTALFWAAFMVFLAAIGTLAPDLTASSGANDARYVHETVHICRCHPRRAARNVWRGADGFRDARTRRQRAGLPRRQQSRIGPGNVGEPHRMSLSIKGDVGHAPDPLAASAAEPSPPHGGGR